MQEIIKKKNSDQSDNLPIFKKVDSDTNQKSENETLVKFR